MKFHVTKTLLLSGKLMPEFNDELRWFHIFSHIFLQIFRGPWQYRWIKGCKCVERLQFWYPGQQGGFSTSLCHFIKSVSYVNIWVKITMGLIILRVHFHIFLVHVCGDQTGLPVLTFKVPSIKFMHCIQVYKNTSQFCSVSSSPWTR